MEDLQTLIAKDLLSIKAVFFRPQDPFTWASGIKSPIYCDNRLILSYPMVRQIVELEIAKKIKKEFPGVEILMGTATAGIAHAALAANNLDLPMGYVRSSAKSHGRENKIEGFYKEGQKVVDTGLYGIVRHPMYAVTIVLFLSMPLILGSLISFVIFLAYPIIIAKRIRNEEEVLEKDLEGYREYKEKVKYKIIPFIW